jgi:hypothetical protein
LSLRAPTEVRRFSPTGTKSHERIADHFAKPILEEERCKSYLHFA